MIKHCVVCKKLIEENNLESPFIFIFGDLRADKLVIKKIFYFHLECIARTEPENKNKNYVSMEELT